jgi:hypothetical protein
MTKTPQTPRSIVKLAFPASIPGLIAVANAIVAGLQGNASFPNPEPSVQAIQTAIADLVTAEAAAQTRAKEAIATRNEKRAALIALLQQLKVYVQKILDANREHAPALAHSVAMSVRKPSIRRARAFGAKRGELPGTVDLVTVAGHHVAYEWQFSVDGGKTWQDAPPTTQARTTIAGLVTGSSYSFRVRMVTHTGPSAWSEPTTLVVL